MNDTESVLDLIGNTPLVPLVKFDTGLCRLLVKLENQNPGGSIKDRIGLSMVADAERRGLIKPGSTLIEATAGNTGLGLALIAVLKGYKLKLVIPDKMSREKIRHLKALGAEIILTRSDVGKGHPDYYQDLAARITAETPDSWYVNQFENAANPKAHEEGTAPEIWEQTGGKVDAVVAGVGSGGTITGLSRFFARVAPHVDIVLADPVGSILAHYVETGELLPDAGSWMVEGIGEDFIPAIADLSRVRKAYSISDQESFKVARELLSIEGILAGSSAGTLVAAALRYCREQTTPKTVVTFICDSGNKYLSKMFDDFWMEDQGFLGTVRTGDLRDLITRKHSERATVTIKPDDLIVTAYTRMKMYEVSQLPVVADEKVVGIVDETDVLLAVYKKNERFKDKVETVMTGEVRTLPVDAPIKDLIPMFRKGLVPVIEDRGAFVGLITRIDFLNFLRRTKDD